MKPEHVFPHIYTDRKECRRWRRMLGLKHRWVFMAKKEKVERFEGKDFPVCYLRWRCKSCGEVGRVCLFGKDAMKLYLPMLGLEVPVADVGGEKVEGVEQQW